MSRKNMWPSCHVCVGMMCVQGEVAENEHALNCTTGKSISESNYNTKHRQQRTSEK